MTISQSEFQMSLCCRRSLPFLSLPLPLPLSFAPLCRLGTSLSSALSLVVWAGGIFTIHSVLFLQFWKIYFSFSFPSNPIHLLLSMLSFWRRRDLHQITTEQTSKYLRGTEWSPLHLDHFCSVTFLVFRSFSRFLYFVIETCPWLNWQTCLFVCLFICLFVRLFVCFQGSAVSHCESSFGWQVNLFCHRWNDRLFHFARRW